MSGLLIGLALLIVALIVFVKTPPAQLASFIRNALPFTLMGAGVLLLLLRQGGLGSMLLLGGFALWRRSRSVGTFGGSGGSSASGKRRSSVRAAALEMELDHETGDMNGMVLVGSYEGQELDSLDESDLLTLRTEIDADGDSLALLDAYLDRRFPAWREDAHIDEGAGEAGPSGTGTMGEKEAYEVLGLPAGASADDIRAAHRRLMKSAHPDSGGSTFLAAKINEAKDVLLKSHS